METEEKLSCNAILTVDDDFGDSSSTFRCQKPEGHEGLHEKKYDVSFDPKFPNNVNITWEVDGRAPKDDALCRKLSHLGWRKYRIVIDCTYRDYEGWNESINEGRDIADYKSPPEVEIKGRELIGYYNMSIDEFKDHFLSTISTAGEKEYSDKEIMESMVGAVLFSIHYSKRRGIRDWKPVNIEEVLLDE